MLVEIFCCYSHKDQILLKELIKHLAPLKWLELVTVWADIDISAGTEWEQEVAKHLNTAHIILLLVSPDFIASDYCYGIEMRRALERHEKREARVIPVILRKCFWQNTPFGKLQALPTNTKPVRSWPDQDEAFFDVTEGIKKAVEEIGKGKEDEVEKVQGRGGEVVKIIGGGKLKGTTVTDELQGVQTNGELQGWVSSGELQAHQVNDELTGRQSSHELKGTQVEDEVEKVQAESEQLIVPKQPMQSHLATRPTAESSKSEVFLPVYMDNVQGHDRVPIERAQRYYEKKRQYLDALVAEVSVMKKADGNDLVPHRVDPYLREETPEVYRLRVLEEIEKRYREIGNPEYSVEVDPIRQKIEASYQLKDDPQSTILGLEAEQERIKAEIYKQRIQKYEQDVIYRRDRREPPEQYIPLIDLPEISFWQVTPP